MVVTPEPSTTAVDDSDTEGVVEAPAISGSIWEPLRGSARLLPCSAKDIAVANVEPTLWSGLSSLTAGS